MDGCTIEEQSSPYYEQLESDLDKKLESIKDAFDFIKSGPVKLLEPTITWSRTTTKITVLWIPIQESLMNIASILVRIGNDTLVTDSVIQATRLAWSFQPTNTDEPFRVSLSIIIRKRHK